MVEATAETDRETVATSSSPEEVTEQRPETEDFSLPTAKTAVSVLALATAACGGASTGGGGNSGGGGGPSPTPTPTVLMPQSDLEAARFALHAALSVSDADISALRNEGYEPWLNRQFAEPIELTSRQFLASRGYELVDDNQWFFRPTPADYMIWNQLLAGGNSVRKRAALALSEFFVVSLNNLNMFWPSSAVGAYWDVLKEHAFGNFRDLLEAITLNAAMGVFLNTRGNQKADPVTGRVPDENYGREVMQLFSIGLFELNIDGTMRTDGNGNPIETYDNEDVTGIAKAFTGYDFDYTGATFSSPPSNPNINIPDAGHMRLPMTADPSKQLPPRAQSNHSLEEKSFLGTTIPAGTGAEDTLRITMDTLSNHPNVGPFFGKQMIQRLVTSNPSPQYVRRVAEVFNDNGFGVRGDLAAVFKAILMDEEALSEANLSDPRFGKLREPMLRFTQWGRTFGAASESDGWLIFNLSDSAQLLGQSPLRPPSVFGFFRSGYVPANSQAAESGLLAPEFQLVNENTAASYINFMELTIPGVGFWVNDVKATYTNEIAIAHDAAALLDRLDLLLTANQLSQSTRDTIRAALDSNVVTSGSDDLTKIAQVWRAVMLVMASNDYLVQQ